MIYTDHIMFWMCAYPLWGQVGGGWALEFSSFLGPVNGIEPIGKCHLGPKKKLEIFRAHVHCTCTLWSHPCLEGLSRCAWKTDTVQQETNQIASLNINRTIFLGIFYLTKDILQYKKCSRDVIQSNHYVPHREKKDHVRVKWGKPDILAERNCRFQMIYRNN
jgi:hypothetical protein